MCCCSYCSAWFRYYQSGISVKTAARRIIDAAELRHNNDKFDLSITHQREQLTDYALTGHPEAKQEAQEYEKKVNKIEEQLAKQIEDKKIAEMLEEVGKMHDNFQPLGEQAAASFLQGKKQEALGAERQVGCHGGHCGKEDGKARGIH